MIYKFLFLLFPFVVTCMPGYSFSEDIVIQAFDCYFIVLLFFVMTKRRIMIPHKLIYVLRSWIFFIICVFASIIIASINDGIIHLSALLKAWRLVYPIICISYFCTCKRFFDVNYFWITLLVSGFISATLGIYGYIFQIDKLVASESMEVGGLVIFRAGSFWQEANVFGLMCSMYALISVILFIKFSFKKRRIMLLGGTFIANFLALCLTYSRSGTLAFLLGGMLLASLLGKNLIIKLLLWVSALCFIVYYFYTMNVSAELAVVVERINSLTTAVDDINGVSSGRTDQWIDTLNNFFKVNPLSFFWGQGYKVNTNVILTDNGYIYILISTGVLGLVTFTIFFFRLISFYIKKDNSNVFVLSSKIVLFCWMLTMMFIDMLTFVPANIFLFLFPLLYSLQQTDESEKFKYILASSNYY